MSGTECDRESQPKHRLGQIFRSLIHKSGDSHGGYPASPVQRTVVVVFNGVSLEEWIRVRVEAIFLSFLVGAVGAVNSSLGGQCYYDVLYSLPGSGLSGLP